MTKDTDRTDTTTTKPGNKIPDPFTPVHNEVFENLVAKWPLSLPALRFTGYVARWSWGWKGSHWTRDPLHLPTVAGFTRMHRATAWKAQKELLEAGIIEIRADGRAKINKYKLAECCQLATAKHQAKQESKSVAISQPLPFGNQSVANSQQNKGELLPSRNQDSLDKQVTQQVTSAERQFKESKDRKRGTREARTAQKESDHQAVVKWWLLVYEQQYRKPYLWGDKDGALLKKLLSKLSGNGDRPAEIQRAAQFLLRNAGQPGSLNWLKPPVTFGDLCNNWNRCVDVPADSDGRKTVDAAEYFAGVDNE